MTRWHFALAAMLTGTLLGPAQGASVWYVGFSEPSSSRVEDSPSGENPLSMLSRASPIDVTTENQVISAVFVDLADKPVLTAVSAVLSHGRMVFCPPGNEASVGIPTCCAFVFPLFPNRSYLGGAAMGARPWSGSHDQERSPFLLHDRKNEPTGSPPSGDAGGGSGAAGRALSPDDTLPGNDEPDTPTVVAPEPSGLIALTGIALAMVGMRRFHRRHIQQTSTSSRSKSAEGHRRLSCPIVAGMPVASWEGTGVDGW